MRPTGAVEYVLHDHLGSARITLDNAARVIESRSYTAFGDELTSSGTGARISYIGRETDNESELGFGACPEALRGRVRMYDPTYGRFLSTDPLWSKYLPLQSYQYAGNNPVMMVDRSGKDYDLVIDEKAKTATVRASFLVDAKSEAAATAAAGEVNALKGIEVVLNTVKYTVVFDIAVKLADGDPIEAANTASNGTTDASGAVTEEGQHAVNSITTIPNDSKLIGRDAAGQLISGRDALVRAQYASDVRVLKHEMLHTLGAAHSSGVMSKSVKDTFFSTHVNNSVVQQMIEEPIQEGAQRKVVKP
jgi:RHS repeat-associated protein